MKGLNFTVVGSSLGLLLSVSYTLCVLWGLLVPQSLRMYQVWAPLLPGFQWLSLGSFLLGLVESFVYGLYIAAIFVPTYNYLARRTGEPGA